MPRPSWHLVTGEFPPTPGGVGDYTRLLADGLARAGEKVHVWTGGDSGNATDRSGVTVHRVAGRFRGVGLVQLGAAIDAIAGPRRLLIQYVPHSYGRRAMNVEFCRWVRRRGRSGDTIWTMFHEVLVKFQWRDRPDVWLTAAVTRWMARTLLRASSLAFVTIPAWEGRLRRLDAKTPIVWAPVPSNIPVHEDHEAVLAIREGSAKAGLTVIGTFGTYSEWIRGQLRQVFFRLLEGHPDRVAWILGRSGDAFAAELVAERPDLAGRIVGPGMLEPAEASLRLQGCDILLQPYPDGVSTRRTSVMAALAHGRPVVSTDGALTEPFWSETRAIRLVQPGDPAAMASKVEELLTDPAALDAMSREAVRLYTSRFALERLVEILMSEARAQEGASSRELS